MTLLFDTHSHLYDEKYDEDREAVLTECQEKLKGWINVGADLASSIQCKDISAKFPSSFFSSGVHPHDAKDHSMQDLEKVFELLEHDQCIASGEMGLDYFYDFSPRQLQQDLFKEQLKVAKEKNMPCIIHVREAFEDFYKIIDEVGYYNGVIHCFTGTLHDAKEIIDRGFYAGFGGLITFKKTQEIRDAFMVIPNDKILLETDSPYMAPTPKRGKRNLPYYVEYINNKMAELKEITPDEMMTITYQNAKTLFSLK
ncbi:MAG: TatD family hydrolase [Candidatus Cloacimonetes bacterium]|nr:TatD family hydrolase [Candidatus Cloacimonadota bacterium]